MKLLIGGDGGGYICIAGKDESYRIELDSQRDIISVRQTASHPYASGGTARRTALIRRRGTEERQNSLEYTFPALRALDVALGVGHAAA